MSLALAFWVDVRLAHWSGIVAFEHMPVKYGA